MSSVFGAIFGAIAKAILGAILARQDKHDTFEAGATAAGLNASEAALGRAARAIRNRDIMRTADGQDLRRWLAGGKP